MNLLQNSIYFRNIFFFRKNWSLFAVEHKTYHNPPEKNIKSNKYTFGAPWLLDLLSYKHWFTSSIRNFCHWSTDVPSDEKSLATRSKEKQLYLQASLWLYEPRRSWDWLTKMQKEKKQGQYSSIVTEQEKVYFMTKKNSFLAGQSGGQSWADKRCLLSLVHSGNWSGHRIHLIFASAHKAGYIIFH